MTASSPQLQLQQVSLASRGIAVGQKSLPVGTYCLLRDISFEVFRGDRVAIVGASGSGKTSLLRLLNRLSEPFAGTIYLEGRSFQQIPAVRLRQQITLVQQETKLLGMTVREALLYPLQLRSTSPTMTAKQNEAAAEQVNQWVERLHIPQEWLDRTELQLSVGQRQWVAIARALITQPQVLLLDEPTSSLDAGRSSQLLTVLAELSQAGQTVLMTNHQLEFARSFCDYPGGKPHSRVLHLHKGRLIENSLSKNVDWQQLKAAIVQAEAEEAEEWD